MKATTLFILTILFVGFACQPPAEQTKEVVPGLDLNNMDLTADPADDFYRFANGQWTDKTEIPADEGRWGGFNELREKNNVVVLDVLERAADNSAFPEGTDERKAINFFSVGMDSALAEKVGPAALKEWYSRINGIQSKSEIQKVTADLHKSGYQLFNGVFVMGNLMNSKINAFYFDASGLGLPNRDYYTKTDSRSREIREKYVDHMAKMLSLSNAGENEGEAAKGIMKLETTLAEATKTPIERRNIKELYNPKTLAEVQELSGAFDWGTYLKDIGISEIDTIIVTEPKFFEALNEVLEETPLEEIKAYMKWSVVNRAAPYLNYELVKADFDFYGKTINGTDEMKPRWERVLGNTNGALGEALGKVYVAETFPPEAKAQAEEMVNNILKAFEGRINNLEWMSDSTKQRALEKLSTFNVKIGYPNKWKDYSAMAVESSGESFSYLKNIENADRWEFNRDISKIGEPVDKEEWGMNPQTVNAYYSPLNNEIVFPAAILQPPFFNFNADPAVNYGGMGAVIGHEISHGFDDQGSGFDAYGNMINWWTDLDKEQFESRTKKLVAQFDAYAPLDSVNVQGALTLGENIGDLGGLSAAYDGLKIHFQNNEKPGKIDGFTQEQRFFLSWATIWRTKYRDETLRKQILTDPHSPGMYRAVGPLVNMDQFYEAFDVKEGDALYKPEEERVRIW